MKNSRLECGTLMNKCVPPPPPPPIPNGTRVLEHQVAGHFFGQGKTLFGALQSMDGSTVLKCLRASSNAPKEFAFYERLREKERSTTDDDDDDYGALLRLAPAYLGVFEEDNIRYLKLDNICNGYRKPCIKDVKIGRITFDLDASKQRKLREISKCPLALVTGFQLVGMKVFTGGRYVYHERICCRSLTHDQLIHGIAYFYQLHVHANETLLRRVIDQLDEIERFVSKQRSFRMFGVSILIVYEGGEQNALQNLVSVKLIDFAHVYTDTYDTTDQNFLSGIVNYRQYLNALLSDKYTFDKKAAIFKECSRQKLDCYH